MTENKDKPKKGKVPSKSKIMCVKCKEVKAVRPEVLDKRVEKYGSETKLRSEYLCRNCRPKKEKAPKTEKKE